LKRLFPFIIFALVLMLGALAVHIDWTWKRKLSPWGGRYFFHRVELAVPSFRQSDEKWGDDPLGGIEANGTLGGEGCAVAAAAMVFKFYGIDVDPRPIVCGTCTKTWRRISSSIRIFPAEIRSLYGCACREALRILS
jgi:hypothetical protein